MKRVARVLYGVFGALAMGLSLLVLIAPELAISRGAYSPLTTHLVREQAAGGVFIGLMAFWCLFHFAQRRPVHMALLVFTALFSAIHWADYVMDLRSLASPLVNSVPFLAFAVTAPFARKSDSEARDARDLR